MEGGNETTLFWYILMYNSLVTYAKFINLVNFLNTYLT